MKIDIWKRPWLAVLLLFLCFLLVGYFERQDQELFERMAPFAPPVNVACTLTLSVKYAPKYEDTVQEALAMLRTVGMVTVF